MKAAICYEFNKPMVIEEVTMEPPREDEVKIRVAATSICHSDIHSIRGEHGIPELPAVGGHEVAGYVEEVGEGITHVKPGDRVIVALGSIGCGQCFYCTIGFPSACEGKRPHRPLMRRTGPYRGISAPGRYFNKQGQRLTQFAAGVAGFVEYTVVSEDRLVKIPEELPFDKAAPLACGVITGYGAVVNLAQVRPLSSVIVVGCGGVGLNVIQGARLSGSYPIIGVDVLDNKLEMAQAFGATHTINTNKEKEPVETAWKITSGRGSDYVFVAVGGVDTLRQAFMMSGFRGMTVIIGHEGEETLSNFEPTDLFGPRFLTGGGGNSRIRVDIPRIIDFYLTGRFKLDELITGHYPLERINEAMESHLKGEALRNVIVFEN